MTGWIVASVMARPTNVMARLNLPVMVRLKLPVVARLNLTVMAQINQPAMAQLNLPVMAQLNLPVMARLVRATHRGTCFELVARKTRVPSTSRVGINSPGSGVNSS